MYTEEENTMTSCLIVEDEPLIAFDLKCRLERSGYTVSGIADSMFTAKQALEIHKPDVVFMDICIKGAADGIELADLIRQSYDVPVIYVTAHSDLETLERAKLTEPFGYIVKPFVNVDFRAQVEIVLWKHHMEQRLRMSEAWLASILLNVADAIIATDPGGIVIFLNPVAEELTGWASAEASGKPLLEVFSIYEEQSGQPVLNPIERLYDGRGVKPAPSTYFLQHRDANRSTLVETKISLSRDEEGIVGMVVCFADVSERLKTEEQRRNLEKTQSLALLATGVGRELSDSLRDTEACLQELLSQSPDRLREIVRSAYFSASNATTVAQQLSELGKREPGQWAAVDLNAMLGDIKKDSRKLEAAKWPIVLDLDPSLPSIAVQPDGCRDNIVRLLREAKRAMPKGGEIWVSTQLVENANSEYTVQLTIRDTGKRLPSAASNRVFEPYYHSRSNSHNAGLSLALIYHFVCTNGGSIECKTSPEGTDFVMCFPAMVTPDNPIVKQQLLLLVG